MELLGNGLAHAMHLMMTAGAGLLIVGKVIFDTFARQIFRQGSAAALLAFRPFRWRQASVRQVDDIVIFTVTIILAGNLFGFIEEAIDVLFAARRKSM
ncbi:hypothetical protein D3C72_1400560 [compost metagenome]